MTTGSDLRALPPEEVFGLEVKAPTKELASKVRGRIQGHLERHGGKGDWAFVDKGDKAFEFRSEKTEAGNSLLRDAHGIAAQFKEQGVEGFLFDGSRKPKPPKA